ncbi:MAG: hypothetical protein IT318_06595 [Anaerolineales bacterium]|nr:hypothetical protein [Anaerolineales bacterium]
MAAASLFYEDVLAPYLPLDGQWSFSLAGSPAIAIRVPAAWEVYVRDKRPDGPARFWREFALPAEWLDGRRIIFEAGAISFHAAVRVNGRLAGEHAGLWSSFQLDISELVRPGANTLELEVWKPGERFPLRETLSGFLPDVATAFGGPWQSLGLRLFGAVLADLQVLAQPDGPVVVRGRLLSLPAVPAGAAPALVRMEIADRALAVEVMPEADGSFAAELPAAGLARWRPDAPALHTVTITAWLAGRRAVCAQRRIGLRAVRVAGGAAWIDERPLHLRGVLDWGWHPDLIAPAPPRERVKRQFAQARALGFNLVKLCLFVPDAATFEAADEAGMLLWLELPMWQPRVTPALRALALDEYAALLRRLHHHPSLVVVSLGCELGAEADAGFLQRLHGLARAWLPNALHCDNSGSAEAYGGAVTALSDFYDYHFYAEPHFFQDLVDHFHRGYRPAKPWLYGEFCDADTCRDFAALAPAPWWLTDPVRLERNDFLHMRAYRQRLAAAGVIDGAAALSRTARRQANAVRKFVCELTRLHSATGGYVITGWTDTPITTAGVVDDRGALKFEPQAWRMFNADGVLLLDRERRRRWVGGDRPACRDPYVFWAGEHAELHVLYSNGLGAAERAVLRWALTSKSGEVLASGESAAPALPAGEVSEVAVLTPVLAAGQDRLAEVRLSAEIEFPGSQLQPVRNCWRLWVVPHPRLPRHLPVAGALRYARAFDRLDRQVEVVEALPAAQTAPFVAGDLSAGVLEGARQGGSGLVWLQRPDARYSRSLPFWREAIHVFVPHPLWRHVPHAGYADLRFFSVAADMALDLAALQALLGPEAVCQPVWRRFDARQLIWAEYVVAVQIGAGRLLITSLRLEGGLGRQPDTFATNPMGAWLFASLLAVLGSEQFG